MHLKREGRNLLGIFYFKKKHNQMSNLSTNLFYLWPFKSSLANKIVVELRVGK